MEGTGREEARGTIDTLTIFTILVRCPRQGVPDDSCPFKPLRKEFGLEEKFRLAESLPEEQRREMLAFHNNCLAKDYAKDRPAS